MVNFTFAVSVRVIDTVIDNPVRIDIWIDIHHRDDADTFDNAPGITTVLPSSGFNFGRIILVNDGIIKQQIPVV